MKNLNLAKIIFIVIILASVFGVLYFVFNKNDIQNQEVDLQTREENIKEIARVYDEKFKTIGNETSAFIIEKELDESGNEIRKDYYVYGEEGKSLIKAKEYEGIYENGTAKLKREIYIDLSKKVEGTENLYNGVTIINIEDWTSTVIDNYEFKTPIEKITEVINRRYDFENDYKEIALDDRNEIYINIWPELNHRSYGWSYEIKEENMDEYLSFSFSNEERNLYFDFEIYEDNKRIEKKTIRVSKLEGSLDDVTVPEL